MEEQNICINVMDNYSVLIDIVIPIICALIGGGLTLFGVRKTIKNEVEMKKEDNSIVYKPILSFVNVNLNPPNNCLSRDVKIGIPFNSLNDDHEKDNKYKKYCEDALDVTKFTILMKNRGRAETYNAILDDFKIREISWDDESHIYVKCDGNQYIGQILKDEYFLINIELPNYIFMPDKKDNDYKLLTTLYISYDDMFNRKKYQYILNIDFNIGIHCYENYEPYKYKGLKYARVIYQLDSIMPENKEYSDKRNEFVYDFEIISDNK